MKSLGFIKDQDGSYSICRAVTDSDIMAMNKWIMEKRYRTGKVIGRPEDVIPLCQAKIGSRENEVFLVIYLNNKNAIIKVIEEFHGSVDQAAVYARPIVMRALQLNSPRLIVSHNHPSQDVTCSQSDKAITLVLKEALKLIDCELLDHIIVSTNNSLSLNQRGYM